MSEIPSFRSSFNGFNRNDVVNYLKKLLDENADLLTKLAEAQNAIVQKSSEIETLKNQLSDAQSERQNEQMLGRAIYDARRFSDTIVKEANDSADAMLQNAALTADDIALHVDDIADETYAFSTAFADAIGDIQEKLSALNQSLSTFKNEVASRKEVLFASADLAELSKEAAAEDAAEDEETAVEEPKAEIQHPARLTVRKVKR